MQCRIVVPYDPNLEIFLQFRVCVIISLGYFWLEIKVLRKDVRMGLTMADIQTPRNLWCNESWMPESFVGTRREWEKKIREAVVIVLKSDFYLWILSHPSQPTYVLVRYETTKVCFPCKAIFSLSSWILLRIFHQGPYRLHFRSLSLWSSMFISSRKNNLFAYGSS